MPTGRSFLSVAELDGILYAIGGVIDLNHTTTNTVEAFDPATSQWTTKSPMPTARCHAGSAVIDGSI